MLQENNSSKYSIFKTIEICLKLFAFTITLFLSNCVYAQDMFKVGIMGGTVTSQVQGDTYWGYNKVGFGAGGFVHTYLKENWSLEMEIIYIQKGSRKNPKPNKGDYDTYLMRLHYVEVPLLIRYHWKDFIFEGGASVSNLVAYKESYNQVTSPYDSGFKRFELSGVIGVYYQYNEKLRPFLKFSNSILPIRAVEGGTNYFNNGQFNTLIFLGLQYIINS